MSAPREDFLWGAATSAHQIEGDNRASDWWHWEEQGFVDGGIRSGRATDHWNRWKQDLDLAQSLGLNSYRFSVEWARIEPEPGKVDTSALDWYENLIIGCEERGMVPMLTLQHFTLPQWLAERGGMSSIDAPIHFARFVDRVVLRLGARVPLWCTINEPMVLVIGSYLGKFMPPATFNPTLASTACRNLLKCHVSAYDRIHAETGPRVGAFKNRKVEVGIAHNLIDLMPDRYWHPLEQLITRQIRDFYNQSWLDAVVGKKQRFSVPFLIPEPKIVQEALGRKTADFIGVNYYTKGYLQWRPRDHAAGTSPELPIGFAFSRRGETVSDLGWSIHPGGFGKMMKLAAKTGLPLYITENGIADNRDELRPAYLKSHLLEVAKAIEAGVDVRGYYYWSLLDNFEWVKGFKPRFGLYQVDYASFGRSKTQSSELYKKWISAHNAAPHKLPSFQVISSI